MSRRNGGHPIGLAVLGGFVLGAATVLLVVWIYGARWRPREAPAPPAPAPSAPVSPSPIAPPAATPAPPAAIPAPPAALPGVPMSPGSLPAVPSPALGPAPPASPARETDPAESADLTRRQLVLPVQGVRPEALRNSFTEARGGGARSHEALDIPAPRNTPILAVEDGKIAKLFASKLGGLTVYQFDPTETYAYYYAHLERYADGLKEGGPVRRGQVLGYVGTSGDAPPDAPHLHFAIFRLTPEKHWWQGTALDPFPILRPDRAALAR